MPHRRRLARAVSLALAPLLAVGTALAAPTPQGLGPAPANLRCSLLAVPDPPVPPPPDVPNGWTGGEPIWEWRDVAKFENEPGHSSPIDVALGADCHFYVADAQRSEVVQYNPHGLPTGVRYVLPDNPVSTGAGRLAGVAVDVQGNVYATEYTRNLVHKYAPNGTHLVALGECTPDIPNNRFCDPAREPGLFVGPTGVAVDGQGSLYVAESAGTRIQKLNAQGQSQGTWSMAEKTGNQLFILGGMAVDAAGFVYVADGFNDHIYKFDPNGALAATFGSAGTADGQLRIARGVAVGLDGSIYTSDQDNWRVQKLTPNGAFVQQWRNCLIGTVEACEIAANGDQPGQFFDQRGLVVDANGTLYVADYGNNRVQRLIVTGYTDLVPLADAPDPEPDPEPDPAPEPEPEEA